jgi:hypothetical protein
MLVHEFDERLLWEVKRAKVFAIYELKLAMDWLELVLRLVRDVLACHQVNLEGVQLFP